MQSNIWEFPQHSSLTIWLINLLFSYKFEHSKSQTHTGVPTWL